MEQFLAKLLQLQLNDEAGQQAFAWTSGMYTDLLFWSIIRPIESECTPCQTDSHSHSQPSQ